MRNWPHVQFVEDTHLKWNAYYRLMRFDKPVGIFLLWFPVAWALWVANQGAPPVNLVIYFSLGTVVMRAAGCVMNDLADRHIDRHVRRTAKRPLTTGEVSFQEGIVLFIALLFIALSILFQLPLTCFYYALIGLLVTVIYPFCKRWLQAPQLMLSVAFSVAIPMVYTASGVQFDLDMALLVSINLLWVLVYDTLYAMVDREDDLRLGVKSTAVLFGRYDRVILFVLQISFHGLWLLIAYHLKVSRWFWVCWSLGVLNLVYQQYLIRYRLPADCFKAFKSNVWYGFVMWFGLYVAKFIRPLC